jgi:hypothetical protein
VGITNWLWMRLNCSESSWNQNYESYTYLLILFASSHCTFLVDPNCTTRLVDVMSDLAMLQPHQGEK